ncbi:hypothetical protein WJX84_008375, partial [Apatococcus fuscideae]
MDAPEERAVAAGTVSQAPSRKVSRFSRFSHTADDIARDKEASGVTEINARVTLYVVLCCIVASFGGMPLPAVRSHVRRPLYGTLMKMFYLAGVLFGYDAGITGGVETSKQFALWFFPDTASNAQSSFWCRFNDNKLQAYSATMHFTGAVASIPAGYVTQKYGRTKSMVIAGGAYIAGAIAQALSWNTYAPLFLGRVLWGIGVGFGDHCAFIYCAEMAPPQWRGLLAAGVQANVFTGILVANCLNLGFNYVKAGWRLSLALAAVPGTILLLGGLFLYDTPNSLMERGHPEKARKVLEKVRGTKNVDDELALLGRATDIAKASENPFKALCFRRKNIPQLVLCIAFPFFQQWSGVNAVSFFAPQIFGGSSILGEGNLGELSSAILVDGVECIAGWITVLIVDRIGRRVLLIPGCGMGASTLIAAGVVLKYETMGHLTLAKGSAAATVILVGLYTISFGFGLGPIAWLVPAEIHDINTRAAGQSFTVFTQLISGAIITQVFLKMLCSLQYWAFIFFGLWQAIACIFFIFLQPETNGIPIEQVPDYVRAHKIW